MKTVVSKEKDLSLAPHVIVHSEISPDLDYDHELALETVLKDCTDEQLISEIARRNIDLQHKITSELVARYYDFISLLGTGASGKVYLVQHRESGEKFACKVVKKDGSMNDAQSMTTEIEIMKRIRHRHIVCLYELFETAKCMWLILELVEGTGLRGVLAATDHYSEAVAARYIRQMLVGIHYLHNHGVIHRDLKIDNMLLHGEVKSGLVKIADFGLSALIKPGTKGYHIDESQKRKDYTGLKDMWGTPTHYSPELIAKGYGPQSDMWSLGCMMFEMLTGGEAFPSHESNDRKDLYHRIRHAKYNIEELKDISAEAQDLLRNILEPDPVKRFSAAEALAHSWLKEEGGQFDKSSKHLSRASKSFRISRDHVSTDRPGHPGPSVENSQQERIDEQRAKNFLKIAQEVIKNSRQPEPNKIKSTVGTSSLLPSSVSLLYSNNRGSTSKTPETGVAKATRGSHSQTLPNIPANDKNKDIDKHKSQASNGLFGLLFGSGSSSR
mmetsp:Transcript_3786/g.3936  ORF Transcript_3786/g.3936 Transcript_3786/m.3936 type:complete len:498 (+) Transcript_3786:209-1702(+)